MQTEKYFLLQCVFTSKIVIVRHSRNFWISIWKRSLTLSSSTSKREVLERTPKYLTLNTQIIEYPNIELSKHHILAQNRTSNMSNITKNWTVCEHRIVRSKTRNSCELLYLVHQAINLAPSTKKKSAFRIHIHSNYFTSSFPLFLKSMKKNQKRNEK